MRVHFYNFHNYCYCCYYLIIGLTIRQAFEIVAETKNNNSYPRVNKLNNENDENDATHDEDDDDDDDGDDDEHDNESKEIEVSECLAKLRLKLQEREDVEFNNSAKEVDHTVLSAELKRDLDNKRKTIKYKELLIQRNNLPTNAMKEEIISVIKKHQITIVCGINIIISLLIITVIIIILSSSKRGDRLWQNNTNTTINS